jgi:hypothetical protein
MTRDEHEQAFRDLGLDDEAVRKALAALSRPAASSHRPVYETITAAHTSDAVKEPTDAKLESGS